MERHRVIADRNDSEKVYFTTFGSSVWHGKKTKINKRQKMTKNSLCKIVSLFAILISLNSCSNNSVEKKSETIIEVNEDNNGRNDQWGFIGPGGGGAMFNPAINPTNPTHTFVSCDMTGSFVTYDGGKKWRMFNLRGVTKFYTFDKSNSNVVYAGTSNILFKSTNKGTSWATIYPKPSDIVAIHAQGDHADEVVVTKDSIRTIIEKLVVDTDNPQKLFLLVRKKKIDFWPDKNNRNKRFYTQILTSDDAGFSWQIIDKLRFDLNNIFIDPTSPKNNRTVYVSGKDGLGVKKDGEWRNISLPARAGVITHCVDGFDKENNKHIIYLTFGQSYFNPKGKKNDSRIYMSDNGGQSWKRIDQSLKKIKAKGSDDPEFRSIAISYNHPENVYISYAGLRINKDSVSFGVAKSADFGKTWKRIWDDRASATIAKDPGISSSNREQGWLDKRFGPWWGENPFHMAIADNNPDICYTTDFGRTIKTTNGGKTWQQVYTRKIEGGGWQSRGLQVTTGYMLAFDPFDSLHIFMADTDTGLMESFDGGKSWSSATYNNGVPKHWINTTYWLEFDPEIKGKLWAVMSQNHDLPRPKMWRSMKMEDYKGGVLVSEDNGKKWTPISSDIGEAAITHIVLDTKSSPENRILYVCAFGKGVYKSIDGGKTWKQKNVGIEGSQPAAWRITKRKDGELFLIVSRKSDDGSIGTENDGALYRSSDSAESWQKINLPEGVNGPTSLVVDPSNQKRMLLSAWGRYGANQFLPNRGGGIYLSEDEGITWKPILTEDQHIHDITIDQSKGVFYATGFNSSAYRSDDSGLTWNRIKGYNFKWGKRVQPDPYNSEKIYIITFGGGVWHGPAKGDENALEDIITSQTAYN